MRKVKDAIDLNTGEKVYFRGHAQATFMSDGRTVEQAIKSGGGSGGGSYDDTEIKRQLTELSAEIIMLDGIKDVLRNQSIYNTNGATRNDNGYYITPYIPVSSADYIGFVISSSITSKYLILYDKDYNVLDYYGLYADKTKIALSIYPSVAYVRMTFKEGEGGSLSINGVVIWDNNKVDFSNVYTKNSDLILAWIITEAFTASNIVRDTDGNVKSLDVTWCDGEQGKMTLTRDADGNATSVTATYYGKTYVLTITRDSEGNVISTNIE